MNSVTTVESVNPFTMIEKAIKSAINIVDQNKGERLRDEDSVLLANITEETRKFTNVANLTDSEKITLSIKWFMILGEFIAQSEASCDQLMWVSGGVLQSARMEDGDALRNERNLRQRKLNYSKFVAKELKAAFV